MTTPVKNAVDTYIRACTERDPTERARLLESSFADDGRIVSGGREMRGRAEVLAMLDRFWSDPEVVGIRVTSVVETRGTIFRYRAVTDFRTRPGAEVFDAGELDASGRIGLILTFAGPLDDIA